MERSLRQKQSPNWLGDGFTTFAMTSPAVRWSQSIRQDKTSTILPGKPGRSHCDGAFVVTEAISKLARRLLHYIRHDKPSRKMVSIRSP